MTTTYSVNYHAYFKSGGVLSGTITANSRRELVKKMKNANDGECRGITTEVIAFEGIVKMITTKSKRGSYIQLGDITNSYLNGKKPSSKYYRRLA